MLFNFESILTSNGFTPDRYDFESTIVGFDYDLQAALFDTHSCFDIERCKIDRQFNNPNAFIRADLISLSGDIDAAIQHFHQRWRTELYYQNTIREIIDVQRLDQSVTIQILTISQFNAMTLLITIK